ncbi:MAG: hypothetical protein CMC13_13360 [Flavobacteriaceae bacterium]|mgnify:CR=1 FL=1|nr:hypothetical protein [Flavobacteriaceae bacterium]|tara:strand:+ start:6117 stop:7295 length:1179 start_codon:yes stop_codon:yes gene_type:complete
MNLLYVTPLWSGLKKFFFEGDLTVTGMPAFFNVFESLLKDSNINRIYVIVFVYGVDKPIRVPEVYKEKLVVYPYFIKNRLQLIKYSFSAIFFGKKIVKSKHISVIYGHGTISALASIMGKLTNVKHYRRIYGTFLYQKVKLKKRIYLTNFFEYLSFRLKCNGLIITNDGTSGNKVFEKIGNSNTPLYFLMNGVNKEIQVSDDNPTVPFFCYIARIDRWKRQNLLINVLGHIKKEGEVEIPKTYIIGSVFDKDYYKELLLEIDKQGLNNIIEFTGPLPKKKVYSYIKHALASFSFYKFSNLGNVFLETLTLGGLLVSINEQGSLDLIQEDTYIKVNNNIPEIAGVIKNIINSKDTPEKFNSIRESAKRFSKYQLKNWNERIDIEKNIILNKNV